MAQASDQTPATIARKLVLALLIFAATFTLVSQLKPFILSHRPLPGADGVEGPCSVWFVGSSTVARWSTMARDMAPWRIKNRGVSGALIPELSSRFESEKGIEPPGTMVVYVGDNDLAAGESVEEIASDLFGFIAAIRERMPDTHLIVLGIKPSPSRWALRDDQVRLDRLLRDSLNALPGVSFADVGASLLVRGQPGPFFVEDGIHLNQGGYRAWGGAVRRSVEQAMSPEQMERCTGRTLTAA